MKDEERYSLILDGSRPEEVVLLQGRGCFWKQCIFCDYYKDSDKDERTIPLNKRILEKITGETGRLTAINSGSFFELPLETQETIIQICKDKGIKDLSIETHWKYHKRTLELKEELKNLGINLHPRIGIETFDPYMREEVFKKGMDFEDVEDVAKIYDECCLLFGTKGQSIETLENDIKTALKYFKDVYLNIYEERTELAEDKDLKEKFIETLYPKLKDISKLHILINNTDLGVGN